MMHSERSVNKDRDTPPDSIEIQKYRLIKTTRFHFLNVMIQINREKERSYLSRREREREGAM